MNVQDELSKEIERLRNEEYCSDLVFKELEKDVSIMATLLKDRHPGMVSWNMIFRDTAIHVAAKLHHLGVKR